jgi:hypothetical protein
MGVSGQHHASAALYPPGKGPPVPIVQEAGRAPEPVWTQRLEEKSSATVWDRTPVVQSVVRHYTDWATPAPAPWWVLSCKIPSSSYAKRADPRMAKWLRHAVFLMLLGCVTSYCRFQLDLHVKRSFQIVSSGCLLRLRFPLHGLGSPMLTKFRKVLWHIACSSQSKHHWGFTTASGLNCAYTGRSIWLIGLAAPEPDEGMRISSDA